MALKCRMVSSIITVIENTRHRVAIWGSARILHYVLNFNLLFKNVSFWEAQVFKKNKNLIECSCQTYRSISVTSRRVHTVLLVSMCIHLNYEIDRQKKPTKYNLISMIQICTSTWEWICDTSQKSWILIS